MGMRAQIIAIGPFSRAIDKFLDYRSDLYAATKEGAIVSRRLFGISEGSTVSQEFAGYLNQRRMGFQSTQDRQRKN